MDTVLNGLLSIIAICYLDDIVVFSKDISSHVKNLRRVSERLREYELKLSLDKCTICVSELKLLGNVVSPQGIATDPAKIECVRDFPTPSSQSEVRVILGLASYYRRFVKEFPRKAKPFSELLEKDVDFVWTTERENAFNEIKDALCRSPILRHWDPNLSAEIHVDASDYGIGATLNQVQNKQEHVVAYASRSLDPCERNYSTIEKEFLALLFALDKFRHFIYGIPFMVKPTIIRCSA
jgi:hypothetical protein